MENRFAISPFDEVFCMMTMGGGEGRGEENNRISFLQNRSLQIYDPVTFFVTESEFFSLKNTYLQFSNPLDFLQILSFPLFSQILLNFLLTFFTDFP